MWWHRSARDEIQVLAAALRKIVVDLETSTGLA